MKNISIYFAILLVSMIGGVVVGAIFAFIIMIAASGGGHLDLTFLLIPGFTTIFIKIVSKISNQHYGYLLSVLIPALILFSQHMLATQRLLAGWQLNNAISSVIILSLMYGCWAFVKRRTKKPDSMCPTSPSAMLSPRVQSLIIKCFSPENAPLASELMVQYAERCASRGWKIDNERTQIAIIKNATGSIEQLPGEIKYAEEDWRDGLMRADFGHDTKAHLHWNPDSDGR